MSVHTRRPLLKVKAAQEPAALHSASPSAVSAQRLSPLGQMMPARYVLAAAIAADVPVRLTRLDAVSVNHALMHFAGGRWQEEGGLHCRQGDVRFLPKNRVSHGACPRAAAAAAAAAAACDALPLQERLSADDLGVFHKANARCSQRIACRCNADA